VSRGSHTFKQTDITRAVKAMNAAGLEVARVEVDKEGKIAIIAGKPEQQIPKIGEGNEWDRL
jgi:hypothetical protein